MKKHSLKIKLTMIMAGIVASVIIAICVLNSTLFEKYYTNNRLRELENSYESVAQTLNQAVNSESNDGTYDAELEGELKDKIVEISSLHNINTFVVDPSTWEIKYASQATEKEVVSRWFQEVIIGISGNLDVLEETDDYTVVRGYDSSTRLTYLEIYGVSSNGPILVMHITIESLKENIAIFNRFVQIVGLMILIISIIIVYFIASKFTKPVKELSLIAEKMSEMDFEVKYLRHDKSELGLLGNSMNLLSDNLQDKISELKKANLELQRDIELKTRNDQMRSEFLSNVSHELKTPIALIQGYAEGLKEGITDDPENMEFYCEVIMDESSKMNEMVKKLLNLNQIEYGEDQLNVERFDMTELISSILKSNSIRLNQNGIRLVYQERSECFVWFDQLQLEEVVTNYISNAINHCAGEKVITVRIEPKDKKVRVSVHNTGKSIPEEDIERIWEKFYKVDKARTREYGGNGIGLSIVKAVLDNFQAQYGVENKQNGVEFWFEIDAE